MTLNPDGSFRYTPNTGYYGGDSFTYRASDGLGDSSVATVNLTVASRSPVSAADGYSVAEDQSLDVPAAEGLLQNDADPESQALSAVLVQGPPSGQLTLNPDGSFRFVPRANFFGRHVYLSGQRWHDQFSGHNRHIDGDRGPRHAGRNAGRVYNGRGQRFVENRRNGRVAQRLRR